MVGVNLRKLLSNGFPNVLGSEILVSKEVEERDCGLISVYESALPLTQLLEKRQGVLFNLYL